jgi:multidrug efflux system membrane fusion protein
MGTEEDGGTPSHGEIARHSPNGHTVVEEENLLNHEGPGGNGQPHPADRARPRLNIRRLIGFGLFGAALVLITVYLINYFFHRPPPPARPEPAAAITTGKSTRGDMNVYLDALGTVTPVNTVTVFSQVTGKVMAVYYRQGQMVHVGDPLVEIDPRPFEATLKQAQGTLERDLAMLDQARMDLARYQAAYARNAIAEQQLADQAKLVVQLEGLVKADQGLVAFNETQLSYCHIAAPIEGRVGLRLVDPGNNVFAGNSSVIVVITQMEPMTVVFSVPEGDLPKVEAQFRGGRTLPVDVFTSLDQRRLASGTLSYLDNQVDTTTGTIRFRATFPNRNLALFPNQFVNARLLSKTLRRVTLVPSAAIQYNGTNSFVYVIQPDHTALVHPVTILSGNERLTAVTELKPGVIVATSGFDRLENGARVMVQNRGAAPGAQAGGR